MASTNHVDLNYLDELGFDAAGKIDMLQEFLNQVPEFVNGMKTSLESGDYVQLSKVAHKAKGSVPIVGLTELQEDMATLQVIAKTGDSIEIYPIIVEKFEKVISEAVIEINEILESLKA